jgi:hypothetical protein
VKHQVVARSLQKLTGDSYQKCLNAIRDLGSAPAELSEKFGWPLSRCDAFLIDNRLDPECNAAWRAGDTRYVKQHTCDNCDAAFFVGLDKKGMPTTYDGEYCPECRNRYGMVYCLRCGEEILGREHDDEFCAACQAYIDRQ